MDLLERYLKQIERYLPYKERKETTNELRSLILDQLDEHVAQGQNQEKALYTILKEMGEPREVAAKYNDQRPLISKEMEPILMLVLKIVSITLPLVVLFANLIDYVFHTETFTVMDVLLDITYNIPSAIYSLVVGIGFIFIFFYLIERFISPKFEVEIKEFNPNLLPKIPTKAFKVTLLESIITILVIVLALYIFNFQPGLISIYFDDTSAPLLNENFDMILPFMNVGWFMSIGLHIYYSFKRRKDVYSKSVEFLISLYSAVILFLLATRNIFNDMAIDGLDLNFIPGIFKIAMIMSGIGVIIGSIVEFVKMFLNVEALHELSEKEKS